MRKLFRKELGKFSKYEGQIYIRPCNLCNRRIRTLSRFRRFCDKCRSGNEILRTIEWLPTSQVYA